MQASKSHSYKGFKRLRTMGFLHRLSRTPTFNSFITAGLFIFGVGIVQELRKYHFAETQKTIINRVLSNAPAESEFKHQFNFRNLAKWEGKHQKVSGIIEGQRVFIRRKKGDRDGYFVLAPITVRKDHINPYGDLEAVEDESQHLKGTRTTYVLNIGWISLEFKELLGSTSTSDLVLGNVIKDVDVIQDECLLRFLQERDGLNRSYYNKEDLPDVQAVSNLDVVFRRYEEPNLLVGKVNHQREFLKKHIDLKALTRYFRIDSNENDAENVYLQMVTPKNTLRGLEVATNNDVALELQTEVIQHNFSRNVETIALSALSIIMAGVSLML